MKLQMTAIFAALFMSSGFIFAATNDITALLQKGLFEEEANHNLEAAMRHYQAAVDGFDTDRQLAATAVFRLGECFRKLGKTNEAVVQYERIMRDFADQTTLAGLSREYLAGKTPTVADVAPPPTPAATTAEEEQVRKIREMVRNSPDLINTHMNGYGFPLQSSVVDGNIAAAELLLANGANVNAAEQGTATPLSIAASRGNKAMIELLLAKGADVNAADKDKEARTPLYHAVASGFKTAAEVLIAHKADVNARLPGGSTPLHQAAKSGFSAVAELLIANGAQVNAADGYGETPLFNAVRNNQAEAAKLLLANKAGVNFTNSVGETPLFAAKNNNQTEVANLLLAAKAEVNHRNNFGCTPLHIAVQNNQTDMVRLLLSNKADVNAATEPGITPLLYAAAQPAVDINLVKTLLENGADTRAYIRQGVGSWGNIYPCLHALDAAIQSARTDEMELLLASHADPNAWFTNYANNILQGSYTPLLWVLRWNNDKKAEELQILLDHGADPDLADQEGKTPLSHGVINGQLKVVQELLDHHADPNKPDNQGLPPLAFAGYQGNSEGELKAALLKAGANEDYQRLARIFIAQKGTGSIGQDVFYKGTNSANHYTLLETLAEACKNHGGYPPVDFPDFAHVVINRLKAGGAKEEINVNLEEILASGDCSKDMPLEWGDVVQIPQLDHLLNEGTAPLSSKDRETLTKCLRRQVQIIVKGQTTKLTLLPNIPDRRAPSFAMPSRPLLPGSTPAVTPAGNPGEKTLYTFSLNEVVHQANVLLLSSDLSRVKVTRDGKALLYSLETLAGGGGPGGRLGGGGGGGGGRGGRAFAMASNDANDLWLRDGDVIEIPERDPNAPLVK
jgi:ankyrin repeat protein